MEIAKLWCKYFWLLGLCSLALGGVITWFIVYGKTEKNYFSLVSMIGFLVLLTGLLVGIIISIRDMCRQRNIENCGEIIP